MTYIPSNTINIFLNIDNNFAVPAYITLYSLIHNYQGKDSVKIYLLTPGDMSRKNCHFLLNLSNGNPLFEIFIIDMKDAYSKVTLNWNYPCTILYRLMIPRIVEQMHLDIDKCIYLDVDTVVEGDISELYNIDSKWGEYYCAGVKDPLILESKHPKHTDKLGIPSLDKYINSGVLLLNLKEINKTEGLIERLEKAGCRNDYLYNDQDAINTVCYEGIKLIPLKYNVMPPVFFSYNSDINEKYGKKEAVEARKQPVVIHYIGYIKPWSYKNLYLAEKWWKYIRMQDENTMMEFISPFIESQRMPLSGYAIVKSTIKNNLIRIGLYSPIKKIKHLLAKHI